MHKRCMSLIGVEPRGYQRSPALHTYLWCGFLIGVPVPSWVVYDAVVSHLSVLQPPLAFDPACPVSGVSGGQGPKASGRPEIALEPPPHYLGISDCLVRGGGRWTLQSCVYLHHNPYRQDATAINADGWVKRQHRSDLDWLHAAFGTSRQLDCNSEPAASRELNTGHDFSNSPLHRSYTRMIDLTASLPTGIRRCLAVPTLQLCLTSLDGSTAAATRYLASVMKASHLTSQRAHMQILCICCSCGTAEMDVRTGQ